MTIQSPLVFGLFILASSERYLRHCVGSCDTCFMSYFENSMNSMVSGYVSVVVCGHF